MKSVDLAICTAVMAMKLHLVTDAGLFQKKTRRITIINLQNIRCDQVAMRSVDMSKRLGNTDQSQPLTDSECTKLGMSKGLIVLIFEGAPVRTRT
jgi:hypothetical protein